jgi:hypothetical protein
VKAFVKVGCAWFLALACAAPVPAQRPLATSKPQHVAEVAADEPPKLLPAERVLFALQPVGGEIRNCLRKTGLEGAVRLDWSVDASGNASHFEFPQAEQSEQYRCLTAAVGSRMFDASKGVTRASWTFVRQAEAKPRHKKTRKQARSVQRQGTSFDRPGRLTSAQVDDVVSAGFKLYAHCFRAGIAEDLQLKGRLALRFTVNEDGNVSDVKDAGSELDDPSVIDCAAEAFYAFSFERPQGGPVRVTCPILFNQD